MEKLFGIECEKAIHFLCKHMPPSEELVKPTLFHCIRVGVYLYNHGYSKDIVLAGILHDSIEDTSITEEMLTNEFGDNVAFLVSANTKDKSIQNQSDRIEALIKQCIQHGEDALIVKAADVIDNCKYFSKINDANGIDYCLRNAKSIFKNIPNNFSDRIFDNLRKEYERVK